MPKKRYNAEEIINKLREADVLLSPAYILLQAADRFQNPTRTRNELWQTDFTYLPVVGWVWGNFRATARCRR